MLTKKEVNGRGVIWMKSFLGTIENNILILRDSKEFEFNILTHENGNHMIQKSLELIQTN